MDSSILLPEFCIDLQLDLITNFEGPLLVLTDVKDSIIFGLQICYLKRYTVV